MTPSNLKSGCKPTGVYPYDVIPEEANAPRYVTEQQELAVGEIETVQIYDKSLDKRVFQCPKVEDVLPDQEEPAALLSTNNGVSF